MFEQAFKNIDDVLWKEPGCTSELGATEQTSSLWCLNRGFARSSIEESCGFGSDAFKGLWMN